MKIYYSAGSRGFYLETVSTSFPADCVEVSSTKYSKLMELQATGLQIVPNDVGYPVTIENFVDHAGAELAWVNLEMSCVRDELEKVQDLDGEAVGTVAEWRNYRKELRSWPENQNFPNKEFRPKSPKSKE